MITRGDAIANTHSNVITIRGDKGYDSSDNEVSLNESAIATEEARLQAEWDAQEYARNRQAEYPPIKDLIVALWENVVEERAASVISLEATRQAIKAKYPK